MTAFKAWLRGTRSFGNGPVAIGFSSKDRPELTGRAVAGVDQYGVDLYWFDGSVSAAGKNLPRSIRFSKATLKEIQYDIGGGADAVIRHALRHMLDLGYDYVGLLENDILLERGWLRALSKAVAAARRDGLRVGAATARTIESRVLFCRPGYAVLWNIGAAMVVFSREGAEAVLAEYYPTESQAVGAFWREHGFAIDAWELWMDKRTRNLGVDWWYGPALFRSGLTAIGCVPARGRNIDHDVAQDFHTAYVGKARVADPVDGNKFALYRRGLSEQPSHLIHS